MKNGTSFQTAWIQHGVYTLRCTGSEKLSLPHPDGPAVPTQGEAGGGNGENRFFMPFNNTYLSRNNPKHLQTPGSSSGRQRPRATHASSNEVSSRLAPCHSSNSADIRLRSSCHLHYEARLGRLPTPSPASSIMHDLWPPSLLGKALLSLKI